MCRVDTMMAVKRLFVAGILSSTLAVGQTAADAMRLDWRRVGSTSVDLRLAAPATGPADEVWFDSEGRTLYVRTHSGEVFETVDSEDWTPATVVAPRSDKAGAASAERLPEPNAVLRASSADAHRVYALGDNLYASEDGGRAWTNLTAYKGESVIGPGQHDLAVSPLDPNQLVVANARGVWKSMDGGMSWSGLNRFLPNLNVRRILSTPANGRGVEVELDEIGAAELAPGSNGAAAAWQVVADSQMEREAQLRRAYTGQLGAEITAAAVAGEVVYAGSSDGRIWVSRDRGRSWNPPHAAAGGRIEEFFVDPQAPRLALAAAEGPGPHVLRTVNTGVFWDDLSANLPDVPAHGITADRAAGVVYAATDRGVYRASEDLEGASQASEWSLVTGNLPALRAMAVKLDPTGSQLYIAIEGYGVYAAPASHRAGALRVVSAADFSSRPAAPGSLVSILGGTVFRARAGDLEFPILASSAASTQIQVPFEVRSGSIGLALEAASGKTSVGLAVQSASPAIFIDRDGAPMLLDADNGLMLDGANIAHSNARIQVLATGLGRVKPEWPTGLAAPLENPPAVVATVKAYLDRAPVEVTRATLAPGYIGLYLVELQLPALVNAGPSELYITANGQDSNRVRVSLEP
jgi:uncharacterized protein (TIGR03437 family)